MVELVESVTNYRSLISLPVVAPSGLMFEIILTITKPTDSNNGSPLFPYNLDRNSRY